jgi:hypothetical protein
VLESSPKDITKSNCALPEVQLTVTCPDESGAGRSDDGPHRDGIIRVSSRQAAGPGEGRRGLQDRNEDRRLLPGLAVGGNAHSGKGGASGGTGVGDGVTVDELAAGRSM